MSAERLKKAGLRITSPRLRVFHFFEQNPERHFTADDIIQEIIAADEHFAAATVYRVLSQLTEARLILRHHFDDNCAVYEFNGGDHHDHLICLSCGASPLCNYYTYRLYENKWWASCRFPPQSSNELCFATSHRRRLFYCAVKLDFGCLWSAGVGWFCMFYCVVCLPSIQAR